MTEEAKRFTAGDPVRLKTDPGRIGTFTGKTKPGRPGKDLRYQVRIIDKATFVPGELLELVPNSPESPLELLEEKKLSGVSELRRTLTHTRLAGKLADVIYSMEVTNTDYHAFQFKPVVRFLMSPTNSLLIADEVGLGKTIEACLIWTELRTRFDQRRLVVLCPAVLREKWRMELKKRIGVNAQIVNASELQRVLSDPRGQLEGFAVICSQQGARPNQNWRDEEAKSGPANLARFLDENQYGLPLIDLLVIDEAHYLRNQESQTHEMGHLFRQVSENLLLLSATPIHNRNEDLFSLLRLLDSETFTHPDDLSRILDASRPLVKARDELLGANPSIDVVVDYLRQASGHPLLRGSEQLRLLSEHVEAPGMMESNDQRAQIAWRLEQVNPLAYVITRTRKRDVTELRVQRDPVPERIEMHPTERAAYDRVTQSVIDYGFGVVSSNAFLLATPQRQLSSSIAAAVTAWQRKADMGDDDAGYSTSNSDTGPLVTWLREHAHEFGDAKELRRIDSKYVRVLSQLRKFFAEHPDEKVVLFSTYRETLNYLFERMQEDQITAIVLHGQTKLTKDEVINCFRDTEVQVLLSSEVGSEGLDLQFCRLLINYDLPWNPMRVEQRIGRLDRIGQTAHVIRIWNLFYADTIDDRIYEKLYDKLDLCREALGDFEDVLGTEIRQMTKDLLADRLTPEQQVARIAQTQQSLSNLKQEQSHLEDEAAHLVAYGDYILNQVEAAKELNRWVTGEDLARYVTDFFGTNYPGCEFIQRDPDSKEWDVKLSDRAKDAIIEYSSSIHLPHGRLAHHSQQPVACRFQSRSVQSESASFEEISQFHPIVRFVSEEIASSEKMLSPAVGVSFSNAEANTDFGLAVYVLCIDRWAVRGLQDIERLAFAAVRLEPDTTTGWVPIDSDEAERLSSACTRYGQTWLEVKNLVNLEAVCCIADDHLLAGLEADYERFVQDEECRNRDRGQIRLRNIELHRQKKREQLDATLAKHQIAKNAGLMRITANRISELESLASRQTKKTERRSTVNSSTESVLIAVVQVTQ